MTSILPTAIQNAAGLFEANFLSLRDTAAREAFDGVALLERGQELFEQFAPDSEEAQRFSGVLSHLYDLASDDLLDRSSTLATLDRLHAQQDTSIVPGCSHFELLSRSGEASIYRALRCADETVSLVALKIPHTAKSKTPLTRAMRLRELEENFENEWNTLRRFDSDRVLKALDFVRTATDKPCLVLEYMDMGSMNVYVRDRILSHRAQAKPFPFEERLQIAIQMASALAVFHEAGLIHNDVKLGNFLINRRGQIKIADPSMTSSSGDASSKKGIRGTPGHLPVETRPTLKKDVFSLGTSLYILLTEKVPFDASRMYSAMFKPPVPSTFDPSISGTVDRAIMKTFANPSERTANAMDLLASLQKAAEPSKARAKRLPRRREV